MGGTLHGNDMKEEILLDDLLCLLTRPFIYITFLKARTNFSFFMELPDTYC